jgi:hypothetical protein
MDKPSFSFVKDPGPEFVKLEFGSRLFYLRREMVPLAPALITEIDRQLQSGKSGAGNRASGYRVEVEGAPPLFVRRSNRGGMMRFMGGFYVGFFPRMIFELALTSAARKRGVPAPEPIGAIVEHVAPAVYRGALITKAITGMTFWEFMQTDDDPRVLAHVVRMARYAIDIMHEHGIQHDDLNLQNLFVSTAGDGLSVVILDFDKSRLYSDALSPSLRRRSLKRLERSVRKLDRERRYFDDSSIRILTAT